VSPMTRGASLVFAASVLGLTGCGSSSTTTEQSAAPTAGVSTPTPTPKAAAIQLRSVLSSTEGACREALLRTAPAGRACSMDAKTSYRLGPKIADLVVSKAQVTLEAPGGVSTGMPIVRVQLDKSSTLLLSTLTKEYVGMPLAFLIGGQVVQAPLISAQISNGDIAVLPESPASDAQPPSAASYNSLLSQVATSLGAK
jgi:hypothetical protein